jgi:hypothetical protein
MKKTMSIQDVEDQTYQMLEVAEEVYIALKDDGVYGPYALGQELWDKFEAAFNPITNGELR